MEVKGNHTLEDFNNKTDGVELFLKKQRNSNDDEVKTDRTKNLLFNCALILAFFILLIIYMIIPSSKVKTISVVGNNYLDKDLIVEKSNLSLDSLYLFSFDFIIENKIKKIPFIDSVNVSHENNNMILIEVVEKQPFGYRIDRDPEILCTDDTVVLLESEYMNIIPRLPLVEGFDDEQQTHLLCKAFMELDPKVIESISDVHMFDLSYDNEALLIYMNDGNYFVTSYYGLPILNSYTSIASNFERNGICLYAYENVSVAYEATCPWLIERVEYEYWQDDLGNYILDKYGAKIIKQYEKDEYGNYLLDEEGNKIVIPLKPEEIVEEENIEDNENNSSVINPEEGSDNENQEDIIEESGTVIE